MSIAQTTRVRGFSPWSPRKRTQLLLDQVEEVLQEYENYLPLTIRQIFYRLVGRFDYDKTELAYNRLCETMNRARRAGLIPSWAIRDDGLSRHEPGFYRSVESVLESISSIADQYNLGRQTGQPVRLFVMCEANGMAPLLYRAVAEFGVTVMSSGGFDSLTAKHGLAEDLTQWPAAEILHIGDHDPSGVHHFKALADDIRQMCAELSPGCEPEFTRLAVTEEQIETLNLPTAPAKKSDRRSFEGETVQAEAIPPNTLTSIVRQAVIERQSKSANAELLAKEEEDRARLRDLIEGVL